MKRITYIILALMLFTLNGCVERTVIIQEDDTVVVDPSDDTNSGTSDNDGDGVTNQQETVDNTDPDDPCSVNLSSQYGPAITDAWKALDCDGDGVSNWQELADQTSLWDFCSYNSDNQDLTAVSQEWLDSHCDFDGVPNGQEIIDGTDLYDHCDLIIANQDPNIEWTIWNDLDCDDDGISNGDELTDGTNPLDANSYIGAGDKLLYVKFSGDTWYFLNDGTVFDRREDENGVILSKFDYDSQTRLTNAFVKDTYYGDLNVSFTYNGDQISQVSYSDDNGTVVYDVTYEGNFIYLDSDGTAVPDGFHLRSLEFDSSGRVARYVRFMGNAVDGISVTKKEYNYIGADTDIRYTSREPFIFDPNTQTYTLVTDYYDWFKETHTYIPEENVKNPAYQAGQRFYINAILFPEIMKGMWAFELSLLSEKYIGDIGDFLQTSEHNFNNDLGYWTSHVQANQYPRFANWTSWGSEIEIEFFYTE